MTSLVTLSLVFCASVFVLNSFSVLITFMLSSVWHAILDNFRPISIWATQLVIYVVTDGEHGEAWTRGSYLQLAGLALTRSPLLTGNASPVFGGAGSPYAERPKLSVGPMERGESGQLREKLVVGVTK